MQNKVKNWLCDEGLALIMAWRRDGKTKKEVADKLIGVSLATLEKASKAHEDLRMALATSKEGADALIENVVFDKASAGDLKASEFWLKHRAPEKWGKHNEKSKSSQENYINLADMINNPSKRE